LRSRGGEQGACEAGTGALARGEAAVGALTRWRVGRVRGVRGLRRVHLRRARRPRAEAGVRAWSKAAAG
jgi:hypothetical protein